MNMVPCKCRKCGTQMLVSTASKPFDPLFDVCVVCVDKLPDWYLAELGYKLEKAPKKVNKDSALWSKYED